MLQLVQSPSERPTCTSVGKCIASSLGTLLCWNKKLLPPNTGSAPTENFWTWIICLCEFIPSGVLLYHVLDAYTHCINSPLAR